MRKNKHISIMLLIILIVGILSSCRKIEQSDEISETKMSESETKEKTEEETKELETRDTNVESLLASMTLEEKVGQMVQASRDNASAQEVEDLVLGSVLSGGGSYPGNNTPEDWTKMMREYQDATMNTDKQIPIIYGIDAVHGLALVKDAVVFPHNIGLGAANDPELMYDMGAAVAEEMKLIGTHWNFSPCVAINTDPRWGRTYECFSSDHEIVTELAKAYIEGQEDHGVVPSAKHYVADGAAIYGTGPGDFLIDQGDAIMSEEELRSTQLMPYKELVDSGVKIIMASYSSWNGDKLHSHEYLITDVLKEELSFEGFVISDWEGVSNLSEEPLKENVIKAVNAGIDMLMEPNKYLEVKGLIIKAVSEGKISEERINDAVYRILTVKKDIGLLDDPYMENVGHEIDEIGSQEYRNLAKELVEKSLVLLKNDNDILPLKEGKKIYVTGPAANDMGLQCGGWGLTWQGEIDSAGTKVTKGTTILEGLTQYSEEYGYEIITEEERANEADIVLLAIGEMPYAEFLGDTSDLSITGEFAHKKNKEAIDYAESLGKPVVTLLVAGRNVIISEYADDWDSIVMCYLPGSEGDGVASVLSGEVDFTGKLPMPYYKSVEDIGSEEAQMLYDFGYGLKY